MRAQAAQRQEEARREAAAARRRAARGAAVPRCRGRRRAARRGGNRVSRPPPAVEPLARQTERDERAALAESLSDQIDIERLLEHDERLSFRRPGIGEDALKRLRRGQWAVQARLDLHGLRSDEAREAVARFLPQAVRDGIRCVRIIHGKGLGSIDRTPVLKDKVLRWLVQRDEVIAFCQAPPFAGGSGALLVLLRAPGTARTAAMTEPAWVDALGQGWSAHLPDLALAAALAWGAGLRLYFVVFLFGAAAYFGLLATAHAPRPSSPTRSCSSPPGFMMVVELFADKLPFLDTIWDAVHTFIRIPGRRGARRRRVRRLGHGGRGRGGDPRRRSHGDHALLEGRGPGGGEHVARAVQQRDPLDRSRMSWSSSAAWSPSTRRSCSWC